MFEDIKIGPEEIVFSFYNIERTNCRKVTIKLTNEQRLKLSFKPTHKNERFETVYEILGNIHCL